MVAVILAGGGAVIATLRNQTLAAPIMVVVTAGAVLIVSGVLHWATAAVNTERQHTADARAAASVATRQAAAATALAEARKSSHLSAGNTAEPDTAMWHQSLPADGERTDLRDRLRDVSTTLARRLQSRITRAIRKIDLLEQEIEDPDLLQALFDIDHDVVLSRRQAENMAVLGGEAPERRSSNPVDLYALLIAAVSEVEHFSHVAIVPTPSVRLHGHGAAEIIHLLAELLENATSNTDPSSPKVEIHANMVAAGLAIEISDRGLGMPFEDLQRVNQVLDGSAPDETYQLLADGRIGLVVVRELARRNNMPVQLQRNIYGGVAAVVLIPHHMIAADTPSELTPGRRHLEAAPRQARTATQPLGAQSNGIAGDRVGPDAAAGAAPLVAPSLPADHDRAGAPAEIPSGLRQYRQPPTPYPPARDTVPDSEPPERRPLPVRRPQHAHRSDTDGSGVYAAAVPDAEVTAVHPYGEVGGRGVPVAFETASGSLTPAPAPAPLPVRTGNHMPQQLRETPRGEAVIPGHNPDLMSNVVAGRDDWLTARAQSHRVDMPPAPLTNPRQGDDTSWPTT